MPTKHINSSSSSVAICRQSRGEGFHCCSSTPPWGSALRFRVGARAMGTLWIDSFKTSVRLDEIKDTAALEHAKRMLKRCCSRLHNIKSGAGSKHNPGEADDLHENIILVLVKAINHAASSVGCCKMSKIEDIFSEAGNMAEEMRKFADQLESLSQKRLGFAQDVQLCLGDADQLGDERDEVPSAP